MPGDQFSGVNKVVISGESEGAEGGVSVIKDGAKRKVPKQRRVEVAIVFEKLAQRECIFTAIIIIAMGSVTDFMVSV